MAWQSDFGWWLLEQAHRDDDVGRCAKWFFEDKACLCRRRSYRALQKHVQQKHLAECLDTHFWFRFDRAHDEWCRNPWPASQKMKGNKYDCS